MVVAIIGLLASVAIPSYRRYVLRAQTVEPTMNVRKLYDSSVSYWHVERAMPNGVAIPKEFPATQGATPVFTACGQPGQKYPANPTYWQTPTWEALNFAIDDPFKYQYWYDSGPPSIAPPGFAMPPGAVQLFHVRAHGDLDCNGQSGDFERAGIALGSGEIVGTPMWATGEI